MRLRSHNNDGGSGFGPLMAVWNPEQEREQRQHEENKKETKEREEEKKNWPPQDRDEE
jgi:hypothetical protein